jgi:hypothetical protein
MDFIFNVRVVVLLYRFHFNFYFSHPLPNYPVDLPSLYKRSIVFFRSLHSLVRLLPSHRLHQKLKGRESDLSLGYRLSTSRTSPNDEVPLGI